MKRSRFCYWSVGTGTYAELLTALVASARSVGVEEDFHLWTDRDVPNAQCHPAGQFDNWGWLFKLVFLRRQVARLDYEYFVFLDADSWFVRHPGDPGRLLNGSPIHTTLESDLTRPLPVPTWWEYPAETFVRLMRSAGVTHRAIYNVNAGMFIVRREAIETVYRLANSFWEHCHAEGVLYVDEPLLSYATHLLCADTHPHTLGATHDFWATDIHGWFAKELPKGEPFRFRGWHRQYDCNINPAIVHLVRGKQPLLDYARRHRETGPALSPGN